MEPKYDYLKQCRHLLVRIALPQVKKLRLETQLVRITLLLLAIEEDKVDCPAVSNEVFREVARQMVELHNSPDDYLFDKLVSDLNQAEAILSEAEAEMRNRREMGLLCSAPVQMQDAQGSSRAPHRP